MFIDFRGNNEIARMWFGRKLYPLKKDLLVGWVSS